MKYKLFKTIDGKQYVEGCYDSLDQLANALVYLGYLHYGRYKPHVEPVQESDTDQGWISETVTAENIRANVAEARKDRIQARKEKYSEGCFG